MTGRLRWIAFALLAAAAPLTAAPASDAGRVTTIRFAELLRRPIGPRGLEPTDRLIALAGTRVRLVGYVAASPSAAPAATLILAPWPVRLDDEDEGLADDLPANVVHVHLAGDRAERCPGPVDATGTLDVGPRREADDRISYVRITAAVLGCLAAPPPSR